MYNVYIFLGSQRTKSTKMVQANVRVITQVSIRWQVFNKF